MPKLRRLSVKELLKVLNELGFEIISQRGSHIKLERVVNGQKQRIIIAGHGNKTIRIGTLKSIYRDLLKYLPEDEIRDYFYSD